MDPAQLAALYSPAYLKEDRSQQLWNLAIAFGVLECVFVVLFFYSRLKCKIAFGLELYLVVLGFLFVFGHVVVAFVTVKRDGVGRHVVVAKKSEIDLWLKTAFVEEFLYPPSVSFPKLVIICLYLRIFTVKLYRYGAYCCAGIIIVFNVVFFIMTLTDCTPLAYKWDKSIPGRCLDIIEVYRYVSLPNLFTDIMILVLPLPVIWPLQIGRMQKIGLTFTFLTASVGMVTAILRLVSFFKNDLYRDVTWYSVDLMTWTIAEPGIYFIASILPSLRPLAILMFRDFDFSTLRSQWFPSRITKEYAHNDTKGATGVLSGPEKKNSSASPRERSGFWKLAEKKDGGVQTSKELVASYPEDDDESSARSRPIELEDGIPSSGILVRSDVTLFSHAR